MVDFPRWPGREMQFAGTNRTYSRLPYSRMRLPWQAEESRSRMAVLTGWGARSIHHLCDGVQKDCLAQAGLKNG